MAYALPVVAFASGGVVEIIADGENGLLLQEATAEALSRATESARWSSPRWARNCVLRRVKRSSNGFRQIAWSSKPSLCCCKLQS